DTPPNIFEQIFDVLNPNTEANQPVSNAKYCPPLYWHRAMRHCHRMADERFYSAETFAQCENFQSRSKFFRILYTSCFNGNDTAEPAHLLLCKFMLWMRWQAGIIYICNLFIFRKKVGDLHCICIMSFHS